MPRRRLSSRRRKRADLPRRPSPVPDLHADHGPRARPRRSRRTPAGGETRPPARRGLRSTNAVEQGQPRLRRRAPDTDGPALAFPPLAGQRLSTRRHLRRRGHQLFAVLRDRREGRAVPDRRERQRVADPPRRGRRLSSGTPICRASPRVSATGFGCTARSIRRPGIAATRASCCSTRTERRSTAISPSARRCFLRHRRRRPGRRRIDTGTPPMVDSLGHTMTSVVINPFFDWGSRPLAADPVPRDRHLRGPRQGHDRVPPRHPARSCAAPTPVWPTRRSSNTSSRSTSPRSN